MGKITTLFFVSLLLFSALTFAARPEPAAFTQSSLPISQHVGQNGLEAAEDVGDDVIGRCEGGVSEEECLMRRTLVAHTDYIYTQHQNP